MVHGLRHLSVVLLSAMMERGQLLLLGRTTLLQLQHFEGECFRQFGEGFELFAEVNGPWQIRDIS
jgi:hypothetical protein